MSTGFTEAERSALRAALLEAARGDGRIVGAALTGSGAVGAEDRWSDIDLAFGVGEEVEAVVGEWTAMMYARYGAVHHTDLRFGAWLYRVFLLANTLQVDLAFVRAGEFRALAPTFQLLWGKAGEPVEAGATAASELVGMGWLYALHARSSLGRGRLWQAEYMISGMRNQAMAMACIRHGLPAVHGKGMDGLPEALRAQFAIGLVRELDAEELGRALRAAGALLLREIGEVDTELEARLRDPLQRISGD